MTIGETAVHAQQRSSHSLVFSANSGRAGSNFLAELLGAAPNVDSGHEREPNMTGAWLRRVAYDDPAASYDERLAKADAIRAELGQIPDGWTYADSSHMFVKTFADVVFDEFEHQRLSVVVLRRDPIDTARSFFELDYFGPSRRTWEDWMIPPTAPRALFHLDRTEVTSQFDLIFGYLVDIHARTEHFRAMTPAVNWVAMTLDELSTVAGASALFATLQLRPPADLDERVDRPVNAKEKLKATVGQRVPRDFVRDRWSSFLTRFGDRAMVTSYARANGMIE